MCTEEELNVLLELSLVIGGSDVKFVVAVMEKIHVTKELYKHKAFTCS